MAGSYFEGMFTQQRFRAKIVKKSCLHRLFILLKTERDRYETRKLTDRKLQLTEFYLKLKLKTKKTEKVFIYLPKIEQRGSERTDIN